MTGRPLLEILRFELARVADDSRFVMGLILQIILVSLLVPLLANYATELGGGQDVLSDRALGFSPIAVWGVRGSEFERTLSKIDRLDVEHVVSRREANLGLRSGKFCAMVGIPDNQTQSIEVIINSKDPRSASAREMIDVAKNRQERSSRISAARDIVSSSIQDPQSLTDEELEDMIEERAHSFLEPLELNIVPAREQKKENEGNGSGDSTGKTGNKDDKPSPGVGGTPDFLKMVFLSFGLCFPLLSGSGMAIQSLTGERELGTIEGLLGTVATRGQIVIGKVTSVYAVSTIQALVLLLVLGAIMEIKNMPAVAFCLVVSAGSIVSAASLVSIISKNEKEAQLAITIIYVFIFVILFGPLVLPGTLAWISPFTPLVRFAAGKPVDPVSASTTLLSCIIFSVVSLWISIRLFGKDGILFGPRPSIRSLLRDILVARSRSHRSKNLLALGFGALSSLPSIFLPLIIAIPSFALLGMWSLPVALAGAALIEEYFKPYAVYILENEITRNEAVQMGLLSGLAFALVENGMFTAALVGTGMVNGRILVLRYIIAPVIHCGLTAMVSYGFWKGDEARLLTLGVASALHFSYNIIIFWVMM